MTGIIADSSAAQQTIERNFRWNFLVNSLDGASFWFGMSFISSTIILPLFVSHFTSSPLLIGLIPFITTAGIFLPQLFIANAVERAPRKKFFPVTLGFFLERLPVVLLAPAVFFLATSQPGLTLVLFFVLYAWFNVGSGVVVIGWQDMIAKIIPVDKRGRFFGITYFIGNGTGILGALTVLFVLNQFTFPLGYVIAFGVAAALIFLSWVFLSLAREPDVPSSKPSVEPRGRVRLPQVPFNRGVNGRLPRAAGEGIKALDRSRPLGGGLYPGDGRGDRDQRLSELRPGDREDGLRAAEGDACQPDQRLTSESCL